MEYLLNVQQAAAGKAGAFCCSLFFAQFKSLVINVHKISPIQVFSDKMFLIVILLFLTHGVIVVELVQICHQRNKIQMFLLLFYF